MDKELLHRIISTGFIRGVCDQAILHFTNRDLYCEFKSANSVMIGRTVSEKYNGGNSFIGEGKIGLPSIESFLKILKTLGPDITAELIVEGRNEKYLVLSDGVLQMKYGLLIDSKMSSKTLRLNTSVLAQTPSHIALDKEIISKFYTLSGAVKDCKFLFINGMGSTVDLILAQSEDYSTGAKMTYNTVTPSDIIEAVKFNVKIVRGALYVNRKATSGLMTIHPEGVIDLCFISENVKTNYYILAE